jgi:hypothetical protein
MEELANTKPMPRKLMGRLCGRRRRRGRTRPGPVKLSSHRCRLSFFLITFFSSFFVQETHTPRAAHIACWRSRISCVRACTQRRLSASFSLVTYHFGVQEYISNKVDTFSANLHSLCFVKRSDMPSFWMRELYPHRTPYPSYFASSFINFPSGICATTNRRWANTLTRRRTLRALSKTGP